VTDGSVVVAFVRVVLSGVAAIFVALVGPGWVILSQQQATSLGAVAGWFSVTILSPFFWILAVLFFALFFAASRLSNKPLRIILFWIPVSVISAAGFAHLPPRLSRPPAHAPPSFYSFRQRYSLGRRSGTLFPACSVYPVTRLTG
jgi:hypothetical protein